MKLKDLLESTLVDDDHMIVLSQRVIGTIRAVTRGNWYQDNILDHSEREIYSASYRSQNGGKWYVELKDEIRGEDDVPVSQ